MEKACEYCGRAGTKRAGAEDGLAGDAYACDQCWKLLQSPATAIPLLRGHLSLEMRRTAPDRSGRAVSAFIDGVSSWRPRPKSS